MRHAGVSHGRFRGYRQARYRFAAEDDQPTTLTDQGGIVTAAGEGYDRGMATWYGGRSLTGRRTASGDVLTGKDLTAAHMTLPFNTRLRVTNLNNGQSVIVRINDRGPFSHTYKLDLSEAAASAIDIRRTGQAMVRMDLVQDAPQIALVPSASVQAVSGTYACAQGGPHVAPGKLGGQICP